MWGVLMEWSVREQGLQAVIEVRCADRGDGLYKARAVGAHGSALLGTLLPERGELFLRRTLSIDSLKRQGAWPVRCVECCMTHSFTNEVLSVPWTDEVLRRCAVKLMRHRVRRTECGFTLSLPYDPRAPFPLTPLFCLSRVEAGCLIFYFEADGTPCLPPEE